MVFKSFHLARQSLAKGFTHGYAQSVVAGVSQNNPLATLQHDRFRKGLKSQHAFASTSTTSALKALAASTHDHQDSGLAAYYTAWQKTQRNDDKEWSQFQFRKLIEWDPSSSKNATEAKDSNVAIEEVAEPVPDRTAVNRAYSTSQVDDFRHAINKEEVEKIALAHVDEAIAQQVARVKLQVDTEAIQVATEEEQVPVGQVQSESPVTVADTLVNSTTLSRTESTVAASPVESHDEYTVQLERLAGSRQYAEIPAIFEAMLQAGLKPSVAAYNALLSAAIHLPRAKHQVVPKALDVYSDMLRRRVTPDTATYTALDESSICGGVGSHSSTEHIRVDV